MTNILYTKAQRESASVILIVTVLLLDEVRTLPRCKPGWYYDTVTGNCDHCSDICHQAETMDTVKECHRKCPGYRTVDSHKKSKCPPEQYYDDGVDRCHLCDTLCLNAEIRGKELDCKNLCPDWSKVKQESITPKLNSSDPQEDLEATDVVQFPLWYVGGTTMPLVVIILAVVASVIVTVIGLTIWWMKRRNKFMTTPEMTESCSRRPHQAEQLESHELQPLTAGGELLTHPHEEG